MLLSQVSREKLASDQAVQNKEKIYLNLIYFPTTKRLYIAVCELTVCNVQFAHRFGQNGENCTSLFQTMCKKKLINVSCLQINAN